MSDYTDVLRAAAPQGTIVTVETLAPGKVMLFVPTDGDDNAPNHITARAALTVGAAFDDDSKTVADVESAVALVRKLAERLYGNEHALGVSVAGR